MRAPGRGAGGATTAAGAEAGAVTRLIAPATRMATLHPVAVATRPCHARCPGVDSRTGAVALHWALAPDGDPR